MTAIRKKVRCKLELLGNTGCLTHCKRRDLHFKENSKLSQLGISEQEYIQAEKNAKQCLDWCASTLLMKPGELLKIPFIRPEDVREYEHIGIDIIKILCRLKGSNWLTRIAKAYLEQYYPGNFFPFLNRKSMYNYAQQFVEDFEQLSIPIVIDNQALTACNFLENLRRFTGKEREYYYDSILEKVVSGYDHPDMQEIQKQCRAINDSVDLI